jgi:hypothetical protein
MASHRRENALSERRESKGNAHLLKGEGCPPPSVSRAKCSEHSS